MSTLELTASPTGALFLSFPFELFQAINHVRTDLVVKMIRC